MLVEDYGIRVVHKGEDKWKSGCFNQFDVAAPAVDYFKGIKQCPNFSENTMSYAKAASVRIYW
jgi:hypothetical protein